MTLTRTILKHWYAISIASTLAPLLIVFEIVDPNQSLTSSVPLKYVFALVGVLGAYTISQVKKALSSRKVQNKPAIVQEQASDEDVFTQFQG